MEKKQRNVISIILLVVGVVFILVAGGIFVSTAWKYLPVMAKQLALLLVAAGMFGASCGISKHEKIGWISDTLFHLGTAFVGFFVIAILGGLAQDSVVMNAARLFASGMAMSIVVGMKVLVQRKPMDSFIFIALLNVVLASGCIAMETSYITYLCGLALLTTVLALFDNRYYESGTENASSTLINVMYIVHLGVYLCLTFSLVVWNLIGTPKVQDSISGIVLWCVVVVLTFLSWNVRKQTCLRVLNSLTLIMLLWVSADALFDICGYDGSYSVVSMVTMFLLGILMVVVRRKELEWIMASCAVVIPYGQIFLYWLDALVFDTNNGNISWSTTYFAYSFIIGTSMFALFIVKYGFEKRFTEWKNSKLIKFAALEMLTTIVMFTASKMDTFLLMAFLLLNAIHILFPAMLLNNKPAKKIFLSLALGSFVLALMAQPFIAIPSKFVVEWMCFNIVIGIVLFRYIWYDKKELLSVVCFVITCVMLGVLLLYNLCFGGIENVLILGMTGIVMLVVAAMQNNKKYVMASSATLILLALYLTRELWLSIAWWVYLFAAGVILVLLAVKKAKEV